MKEYDTLCRALQDAVGYKARHDGRELLPERLRVDLATARCAHEALVALLLDQGVITLEAYEAAVTQKLREEVTDYEAWLSQRLNSTVSLT